jgi:TonB family protein
MLAGLMALGLAAAADPPPAPPAPPHTVSGVVVQPQPSTEVEKSPDARVRSAGGADEALGNYVAIWPKHAYAAGKDGRVTLSCLIDTHGLAEWCRVAAETPPGQGFGRAALELKPTFKLTPATGPDGKPVAKVMQINVSFRAPDFQFDQAQLAREMWDATHNPVDQLRPIDVPYQHNRLEMHGVTMVDNPVWVTAASFDDLAAAYPAKGAGVEGYAAAHCQVVRVGPAAGQLKDCQVIKETPQGHEFGRSALGLAARFRLDPAALPHAPQGDPLWVDVPIRFPSPAEQADRTVRAPVWLTNIDIAKAAPSVFPLKALEDGLKSGRGTARCTVAADGALTDCAPDAAEPEGRGFSEAVVKLAPMMRVNLWSADGAPVQGGVVRFPLTLTLPGAAVAAGG